jgi:hypothetical protein
MKAGHFSAKIPGQLSTEINTLSAKSIAPSGRSAMRSSAEAMSLF